MSITKLRGMKAKGERIPMLTAYDYPTARIVDEAGLPLVLVGDSLGMLVLGFENTIPVTMDMMVHHTQAVARGAQQALIVADLPFMSYQVTIEEALHNAARLIQAGAQAVKLEGGAALAPTVRRLVDTGIPVMAHIGLTPQSLYQLGGYRIQGKTASAAARLVRDAQALAEAGAFAIVLEEVAAPVARLITRLVPVPTIGIGAGAGCDGQVLTMHDMLALPVDHGFKHNKVYARLGDLAKQAVAAYAAEVRDGAFPTEEHSFSMDDGELRALEAELGLTAAGG
jgi:3-methyl-2-oxobutanoate hydroxymethyltransferase